MTANNFEFAKPPKRRKATYIEQHIAIYRDNPCIEALSPILTPEQVMGAVGSFPPYDEAERLLPAHERLHAVQTVFLWIEPMGKYVELEQKTSRAWRKGYIGRDPRSLDYWPDAEIGAEFLKHGSKPPLGYEPPAATGLTVVGDSGLGKTSGVKQILSLESQIIEHDFYKGKPFPLTQLVYVMIQCPYNGGLISLCENFFRTVDRLLGKNYYKQYVKRDSKVNDLLDGMFTVTRLHDIGGIFIDEIQNLTEAKQGDADALFNFFVDLDNTLKMPCFLIGTPKAIKLWSEKFRTARRITGVGGVEFTRMTFDANPKSTWNLFVEAMWKYLYVHNPSPLTGEIKAALYRQSQGITDLVVKIFVLAQIRAIETEYETLSPEIIDSVKDELEFLQPMLNALREGDNLALAVYEDLREGINIKQRVEKAIESLQLKELSAKPKRKSPEGQSKNNLAANVQSDNTPETPVKKPRKKKGLTVVRGGLLEAFATAAAENVAPHKIIEASGFIRGIEE